jgi:hypothetical protein
LLIPLDVAHHSGMMSPRGDEASSGSDTVPPCREIARRVGAAPSTVRLTIRRLEASGLSWPLPDDVTDAVLESRLFAKAGSGTRRGHRRQAEPDWAAVHRELQRST